MSDTDQSLHSLFNRAKTSLEDLDTLDPSSPEHATLLTTLLTTLRQCQDLTTRGSLFSPNETLDDIATTTLPYLSIPYLLSELKMRSYSTTDRKSQLSESSALLEDFLTRLDEYDLLKPPDKKLFDSYKEDRANFRIISESAGMEAKRNTKIRRFQEEKTLKARLRLLREQTGSLNVDEEVIRNLYHAELELHVHQSFQGLDLISQELNILAQMPSQPDTSRSQSRYQESSTTDARSRQNGTHDRRPYSDRLDQLPSQPNARHGGILDSSGRPLQPFTLTTSKRNDLQRGVFRTGHNLPTMSIDEYLEEERRRGGIIEGGTEEATMPDEDDMNAQDEATMKAREWDEFVEANPKGAGNTLNRG